MTQYVGPSSSRKLIAQGLLSLIQGLVDPATSAPLFQAVQLGAFFAPQNYASWAEIAFHEGKSGPKSVGGQMVGWRVEDVATFAITSGWDYEADASLAMLAMLNAQDLLLPLLHSHVKIPNPNDPHLLPIGSVWAVLEEHPDRAVPVRLPVGRVYLLWHVFVQVKQAYNVLMID